MAGGGASVIYADTVSGPSPMHGLYNFPQTESMELYMALDDYVLWSKDIATDAVLSVTGRSEIWVMRLSLVIMQNTVELQMRRRCCNMPELLLM